MLPCANSAKKRSVSRGFQWAPTLGGECYAEALGALRAYPYVGEFQWAPTLGGECYKLLIGLVMLWTTWFQWAPTLGGECYIARILRNKYGIDPFQWAPTLGGECYITSSVPLPLQASYNRFNGHPPLGVNATEEVHDA